MAPAEQGDMVPPGWEASLTLVPLLCGPQFDTVDGEGEASWQVKGGAEVSLPSTILVPWTNE